MYPISEMIGAYRYANLEGLVSYLARVIAKQHSLHLLADLTAYSSLPVFEALGSPLPSTMPGL